tara:strand:- start:565 stop:1065 length:501 start_codon:yes stop_codon:yes gene_type:complete
MLNKFFIYFLLSLFIITCSYGKTLEESLQTTAGSGYDTGKLNKFKKAVKNINSGIKYENNNKIKKAKKKYQIALDYLLDANKEKPGDPNIINYLGYTTLKLGDSRNAELYYLLGLSIKPDHIGINKHLAKLYLETQRIDKAKQRLIVLENCNCEEYQELKSILANY